MKFPIEPKITELGDGVIHIIFYYPSFGVKSLLRWIFKRTMVYDQYYEVYYKMLPPKQG